MPVSDMNKNVRFWEESPIVGCGKIILSHAIIVEAE